MQAHANNKIFFWNVQHLAEGSPDERAKAIQTTMDSRPANLYLFCEIKPNNNYPQAQCINYRKATSQQNCYGALNADFFGTPPRPLRAPIYSLF